MLSCWGESEGLRGGGAPAKRSPPPHQHTSEKAEMEQNKRKTMFFHQTGEGTIQ